MTRVASRLFTFAASLFAFAVCHCAVAQTSAPTLSINDQTISATVGVPVSAQIAATGATEYHVIVGRMPDGLLLNTSTGAITRTPLTSGTSTAVVQVSDGLGHTAQAKVTFVITAASSTAPLIGAQTLSGAVGTAFTGQIQATGASQYQVTSGTLPSGLVLNTTTGAVTGTPQIAGSTTVTVQVRNTTDATASASVTFNITATPAPRLSISDQTINGTVGTPVNGQIAATGATGYYAIGNIMPYGLQLNATTGAVTGTPTMSGRTTVQIKVVDATGGSAQASLTVDIAASVTFPGIAGQTFNGTAGAAMNAQIKADNATEYAVVSGTLPAGLALNATTGAVTGTPQSSGITSVTIQVKNSAGSATAGVSFNIAPDPNATPTINDQTVQGTVGTPVNAQIAAKGATAYYIIDNTMPYGLQLNATTGAITGTPTMSGHTIVQIKVSDAAGHAAQANLAVNIEPGSGNSGGGSVTPPPIIPPSPPTFANQTVRGVVGAPMSATLQATGATEYMITFGTLPGGLTLNSATGIVSGTPAAAGAIPVTIQAKNTAGLATAAIVTFDIAANTSVRPTISDQTITGTIDTPLNARIQAQNTTSYSVVMGSMPPGLRLDTATGAILGTPTVAGTSTVGVRAADAAGAEAKANVTFSIAGANAPAVITQASVDAGDHTRGVTLSLTFSRPVSVTLQPVINLTIGGRPVTAKFASPSLGSTDRQVLQFSYTVSDGVQGNLSVQSPVNLQGGKIITDDGAAASLSFTPPDTSGIYVGVPPPTGPVKTAQTITFSPPTTDLVIGQAVTLGATSSAGLPITYSLQGGNASLNGNVLTPLSTDTLVVRAANAGNDTYAAAATQLTLGNPRPAAQQVVVANTLVDVTANTPLTLVSSTGANTTVSYKVVSGPATISGDTVVFTGTGNVTVQAVTQTGGAQPTVSTMTVAAHPVTRLVNVSSRVYVAGTGDTPTVGFLVTGSTPKQILLRAVGDSLANYGVSDGLANPTLTLYGANGVVLGRNAGWGNDPQIAAAGRTVGAFDLGAGKTDAALLTTLAPGSYTVQVTSNNRGSVLLEVYDVASTEAVPTKQLINVSTRARVDAATQLVQGFVISGDLPKRVLVRAVGPSLRNFGVTDAIGDPSLSVYSGDTLIASDQDWGTAGTSFRAVPLGSPADISTTSAAVGAFALPAGSKDAALLLTLQPGAYTAIVSGTEAQSGTVLVEAYEAP